jgi:Ca-activated chloride channel family protein
MGCKPRVAMKACSASLPILLTGGALALAGCGTDLSLREGAGAPHSNNNSSNDNRSAPYAGVAEDAGAAAPPVQVPAFNAYVEVKHDPFSTFAADVDSASYDIFVKSMDEGAGLPAPITVRSEEFVNFFTYAYPAPDPRAADPFAIHLDLGFSPTGATHLLRVGIQGKDLLADRPPANLVFLIDTSGSMAQADKLPLVQEMLRSALDVLQPDDRISVVTYSGNTEVALPVTEVRDRVRIEASIVGLGSGGSTAGAAGLQLAYDQAAAGFIRGGVNHILLCTDGDFNVGPSSTTELVQLVEDRRRTGVTFTALGFGRDNLNDDMMEAISNAGNGIYRVISGVKTAERYVATKLLSDVVHIAKDVKLQVEFNPEHVLAYRQVGYENRQLADEDFRDDVVDAGEIGSGHQMTALYEVVLAGGQVPAPEGAPAMTTGDPVEGAREVLPGELVRVKLRYKFPGATEADPATELSASLGPDDAIDVLEDESAFAWAVATFAGRMAYNPFVSSADVAVAAPILSSAATAERRAFAALCEAVALRLP